MQSLLQRRAVSTNAFARAAPSSRPVRVCKRIAHARSAKASRRATVECQAFFNFFTPKPAAPVSLVDPRAKPLVEQLIGLTSGTDAGAKASPEQKEEIANVITELSRYCIKNPLKSDLLFGEWKVLFSSKPTAVGGPLRSGAGPAVFPGQSAKQILEAPNKLINDVEYKTLGFLPGFSRQYGTIEPISADTFILNITDGEISTGLGGPVKKTFDIKRKIKILYLDDEVRVALFLPDSELPDTEADQNGGRSGDDVVFVFQRITEEAEEAAAEPEGDDGEAPRPAPFFGGSRKLESAATVAERQVRQQLNQQRGGSSKVVAAAPPPRAPLGSSKVAVAPAKPGTQRGRRQAEEPEEDPRERRRREQEEERARKAAEAEAKAAERQAEREKQAAIKELLAQLANEIKERQAAAKEALKEFKDVEKSTAAGLKESSAARAKVEEVEADIKTISEQLEAAAAAKREAEKAAKEAKEVVVAAEKGLRARIAAALPALGRK